MCIVVIFICNIMSLLKWSMYMCQFLYVLLDYWKVQYLNNYGMHMFLYVKQLLSAAYMKMHILMAYVKST